MEITKKTIETLEQADVVRALAALAHPLRLDIFRALVVAGPAGLTPGVLTEQLQTAAATLSFHLKELTAAGLITAERASRNIIYRADFTRMGDVIGYLTDNCCQGRPCGLEPSAPNACSC